MSVKAVFFKVFGTGMEQNMIKLIQTYKTIPYTWEAFICARTNDVVDLQKFFATAKASPYDCVETATPFYSEQLRGALEACMFLLRAGVDPLIVAAGYTNGGGLLYSICLLLSYKFIIPRRRFASQ